MRHSLRTWLVGTWLGLSLATAQAQINCRPATLAEAAVYTTPTLMPGVISPKDGTCFVNQFKVRGSDGVELAANVFLPAGAAQGQKFPAVVFITSWASAEFFEYLGAQHKLAKQGYVALAYTSRGFLNSGGVVRVASPQDVSDVSSAIDWLLAQTPADPARVGVTGISYGAGLSLLSLANDARIKTAVAMSGWGDLVDQLYGNQVPNQTWAAFLLASGYATARMDPEIAQMARRILNPDSTPADIEVTKAWAAPRSPSTQSVVDAINARQAPVMITKNWRDEMFTPNSSMALFERLTGPKKLMLQPGIHASTELPGAILGTPNAIYDETGRWFDRWLKGIPNGIDTEPKVKLQTRPGASYETLSSWPAPELQNATFYLGPRGGLRWDFRCRCWQGATGTLSATGPAASGADSINNWLDTTATTGLIPVLSPLADSVGLPVLNLTSTVLRDQGIRYRSAPVSAVTRIRGIPKVQLRVTPSQARGMLVAHLYSMDRLGWGTLITHGAKAVHWASPRTSMDFSFELNATGFDVPAGHRIELVFDTIDSLYASPVRLGEIFSMQLHTGGSGAALVLPVR